MKWITVMSEILHKSWEFFFPPIKILNKDFDCIQITFPPPLFSFLQPLRASSIGIPIDDDDDGKKTEQEDFNNSSRHHNKVFSNRRKKKQISFIIMSSLERKEQEMIIASPSSSPFPDDEDDYDDNPTALNLKDQKHCPDDYRHEPETEPVKNVNANKQHIQAKCLLHSLHHDRRPLPSSTSATLSSPSSASSSNPISQLQNDNRIVHQRHYSGKGSKWSCSTLITFLLYILWILLDDSVIMKCESSQKVTVQGDILLGGIFPIHQKGKGKNEQLMIASFLNWSFLKYLSGKTLLALMAECCRKKKNWGK